MSATAGGAEPETTAKRSSILCVDDEAHNLAVFEAAFEDDYDVYTAGTARGAIAILRRHQIDLVVTDQRMPQMTGVQLLEAIGSEYPDTVRIILTGFTDIEAIIQAINTGRVDHYVTKPWDQRELKLIMDNALKLQLLRLHNLELVKELGLRVERERGIRELFQKYVPEPVVKALLQPGRMSGALMGESRIASVVFIRIPRFQELSHGVTPATLVQVLNRYFTLVTRCILEHKGMTAEFFAEGVLAVFGVPVSTLNNEDNAVRAALAMVAALDAFNAAEVVPLLGQPIAIGIGIHRGEVIAGNIGAREHKKYGVVGDTVNVASRIQGRTREDRSEILLSAATREWLDEGYSLEDVGEVELRGKSEPVRLFRVTAHSRPAS